MDVPKASRLIFPDGAMVFPKVGAPRLQAATHICRSAYRSAGALGVAARTPLAMISATARTCRQGGLEFQNPGHMPRTVKVGREIARLLFKFVCAA